MSGVTVGRREAQACLPSLWLRLSLSGFLPSSGEVGEVLQPPAVLQVQSGLRGAERRAGGLPSPRPLVPHRQPEERGHTGNV